VLPGGDPADVPAVREDRAGVQDEGSQLVALALAAARVEGRDERWLDMCAGPGGKAALLGALAYFVLPIDFMPDVQLWPHRHGTDAMYLALLRRR